MLVTLREAVEAYSRLNVISQNKIQGRTKFTIARLTAATREYVEQFEKTKGEIFTNHGATLNEDQTQYDTSALSSEEMEAIQKEISETLNETVEIHCRKIKESELDEVEIPPSLIEPILVFIEDDSGESS